MKYKFKKIDFSYGTMPKDKITYDFGVDYESLDEMHKVLFEIAWHGWTSNEVQLIINNSSALTGDAKYRYQVEGSDLMIYIHKDRVYFFDKTNDGEEADLIWTFDEFIGFMKSFKKFLADIGR
ncbi:hypothetical protein J3D55_000626 [Chryseobacterium ginsenosidimutans]|uniref:hypothetical protein n=1 Tax=Chryseobacterium ginsenosidimutans TaxID=687846 RepID=UPI0021684013|nr:hypothetical protein [Chryseobacterium ginsenosidimutans]MCS3867710.1 hypothetical protein [Chryseobacterium ginsenosidimutans]